MRKETITCSRCKKDITDLPYCAEIHYTDTFGNNDGSGSFVDETDETLDLCVSCKQSFWSFWLEGKEVKALKRSNK